MFEWRDSIKIPISMNPAQSNLCVLHVTVTIEVFIDKINKY